MTPSREYDAEPGLEDYLVLAAVLLLPWAFGGVDIWAYRAAGFLLVAGGATALWKRGLAGWGLNRRATWLIPAFLLAAWGGMQLVPLPPQVVKVVSPEAYQIYSEAFPGYPDGSSADALKDLETSALARVPEAEGQPLPPGPEEEVVAQIPECLSNIWRPISLQPTATLERLLWYLALLLGFLVVRERVQHREIFRMYRLALFGLFAALAAFAFLQSFTWNGKILWVRRVLVVVKPFGPYFNPTNFAAVMELAVPALAGYAWSRVRRTGREAFAEGRFVLSAVGAVLCLAAGLAAASKLAALLIVVFLVLLGLIGVRGLVMRLWLLGGTVVAATSGIFLLQATRLGERVQSFLQSAESGHLLEGRLVVWRACKEMILDFPLTGAGFGAFAEMFGHYQARGARARWSQAHNDYLEVLVDGGAIAAVLVLLLSWGYLRRALPAVRRKGEISVARLGLLLGVVSLALHGFVDFNHQIPANALLFVTVAALTLSEEGKRSKGRP